MDNSESLPPTPEKIEEALAKALQVWKCHEVIGDVAKAVLQASADCSNSLKYIVKFPTKKEIEWQSAHVLFEFACFFTHVAMRTAFHKLGPARRDKFQNHLRPLIVEPFVRAFFRGPDDAKNAMIVEYYEYMDASEKEYAGCKDFLWDPSKQNEVTSKSVMSTMARNVMELSGYEVPQTEGRPDSWAFADYYAAGAIGCRYSENPSAMNPGTFLMVTLKATATLKQLHLDSHIESVGQVV